MFASKSVTTEMPIGSITFTSSTPGLGVCPAVVEAVIVGRMPEGRAPVAKVWSGVVSHFPFGNWICARMWYVVLAFMPATRIDTCPPPGGARTGAVDHP